MKAKFIYEAFEKKEKEDAIGELLFPNRRYLLNKYFHKSDKKRYEKEFEDSIQFYKDNPVNEFGFGSRYNELKPEEILPVEEAIRKFILTFYSSDIITIRGHNCHNTYTEANLGWRIDIRIKDDYYFILNIDDIQTTGENIIMMSNSLPSPVYYIDKNSGFVDIKEE